MQIDDIRDRAFNLREKQLQHRSFLENYDASLLEGKLRSELHDHQKTFVAFGIHRENNRRNGCAGGFLMDAPGVGKV